MTGGKEGRREGWKGGRREGGKEGMSEGGEKEKEQGDKEDRGTEGRREVSGTRRQGGQREEKLHPADHLPTAN